MTTATLTHRLTLARRDLAAAQLHIDQLRERNALSGRAYPAAIVARDHAEGVVAWHEAKLAGRRTNHGTEKR